jgi:hypothetical protein
VPCARRRLELIERVNQDDDAPLARRARQQAGKGGLDFLR